MPVTSPAPKKERNPFYDNLKFILISFVVIGHFLGIVSTYSNLMESIVQWIYLFHMPAFLFVSGMFAKGIYRKGSGLRIDTLVFYLLMGVLFYTALWLWRHTYNKPVFDLLNMNSIPWYFFVIAILGASTAIVGRIPGGAKVVIPVSIVLAVGAGFVNSINDFLCLARSFTFAPFFYAGYFLPIDGYAQTIAGWRAKKWPVALAVALMVALFVAVALLPENVGNTMHRISKGNLPYHSLKQFPSSIDALIRLGVFASATAMIVAISLVTPAKRCAITELGARTMQVYILHPFIYYPLKALNGFKFLVPYLPWSGFAIIVGSVTLAALLALPPWPEDLFRRLRKALRVLFSKLGPTRS